MVRVTDPTSQTLLTHFAANYIRECDLANLIMNIMFLRNTMSRQVVKWCLEGGMPWIRVEHGRIVEESQHALTEVFLKLNGAVFFTSVEPQKSRAKCPRRGWGELVSELVSFAGKAKALAAVWRRANGVENLAIEIRKISGFGGKGFRMKEILLDLVEVTRAEIRDIDDQLVDFGVVGPGPRRILNWINGRRWFDNDQDTSPTAERMYIDELRGLRGFLIERTAVDELRNLNLLGFSKKQTNSEFALAANSEH